MYNKNNGSIFNLCYHIVFIPKYRKKILIGHFKDIIEKSLLEKSVSMGITIEKYEIMPDHVHLFVRCGPTDSVSTIVKQLKGFSSYKLKKEYPQYRKYKHFWAKGYFAESVGHISEETIKKYIDNQWKVALNNGDSTSH